MSVECCPRGTDGLVIDEGKHYILDLNTGYPDDEHGAISFCPWCGKCLDGSVTQIRIAGGWTSRE